MKEDKQAVTVCGEWVWYWRCWISGLYCCKIIWLSPK